MPVQRDSPVKWNRLSGGSILHALKFAQPGTAVTIEAATDNGRNEALVRLNGQDAWLEPEALAFTVHQQLLQEGQPLQIDDSWICAKAPVSNDTLAAIQRR